MTWVKWRLTINILMAFYKRPLLTHFNGLIKLFLVEGDQKYFAGGQYELPTFRQIRYKSQ